MPDKPEDELRTDDLPIVRPCSARDLRNTSHAAPNGSYSPSCADYSTSSIAAGLATLSSIFIACLSMAGIHITDIEAAINFWREAKPSADGVSLPPEWRELAQLYGDLVYRRQQEADERGLPPAAYAAWKAWYDGTPDTPCIAICSTSQGDDVCRGCGRSFSEVQHWPGMTPAEKRRVWRRITLEGTAWRFNRYQERAGASPATAAARYGPCCD
jgi:uncharacterized protein